MEDWTKRFTISALLAFLAFFFALPVGCMGMVLAGEHRYGDVQSDGPTAVLGGAAMAFVLASALFAVVWRKTRPIVPVSNSRGERPARPRRAPQSR